MRVLVEAEEGELAEKLDQVVERLREEAGGHLCKAHGDDQAPRELDTPALQQSIDKAVPSVERIRRAMVRRLEDVLKRAV